MRKVYVVKTDKQSLYPSMLMLLKNFETFEKISRIGIKLNLCDYRLRESGATSDPLVVEALIKSIQQLSNADIYLMENDASGTQADTLFHLLGFERVAKEYGCKWVNLANEEWIERRIDGLYFDAIEVPKIIEDCDLLINHPKLKTHGLTKISIGLKNLFGCIRDKHKFKYHEQLDDAIVDINLAIHCGLTIVDGYIGLEKWGPTFGIPKHAGLFIGGTDVVSVDSFCAKLMGFHPFFVTHLRKASSKGIGEMKYDLEGDLKGTDLEDYRFDFDYLMHLLSVFIKGEIR